MSGTAATNAQPAVRRFGRYEIRQMIARSQVSGAWLAHDPRLQQDVQIVVPRSAPSATADRDLWVQEVRLASRLKHPRLADIIEVTALDAWPYATVSRQDLVSLAERITAGPPLTPLEVAKLACDVLEGLAYAHEAGRAHHDIALHHVLLDKQGRAQLSGLGAGILRSASTGAAAANVQQTHREATERDLLMVGLLMYRLLANNWALDDHDLGHCADRVGLEIVRLPFSTPHPVPETLRAIVNRATDRQQRQRYLNARTLLHALQGWVKTNSDDNGGPLLLLLDRLNSVGTLPGRPNTERALIGALSQETLRVDDFVDVIVQNPAMSWEMMRTVNTASYRSHSSDEGVTTLSRAVLLLGQQGVRKLTQAVRPWPGALGARASLDGGEQGALAQKSLERELQLATLAAHIARWMAPFELSDEECALAAMSQRLGWLLVLYHFPEEAAQMKRLMEAGPPAEAGGKPTPGMSLEGAAGAVLGINIDELTVAVLRHWGWEDRLQQAARPLSRSAGVHTPRSDDETLRAVASVANELASTQDLPADKGAQMVHQIQLRYARALHLEARECQATLDHALKLLDRPVVVGAGGDVAASAAPTTRKPPAAAREATTAEATPAPRARPPFPSGPTADTSPVPLMPAGSLSTPEPGSLRARLASRAGR